MSSKTRDFGEKLDKYTWWDLRVLGVKLMQTLVWLLGDYNWVAGVKIFQDQENTATKHQSSPDLQVHDDLSLIHIFRVNFDPIDPEGLQKTDRNIMVTSTPQTTPNTPSQPHQGKSLSRPCVETICAARMCVSDLCILYVFKLRPFPAVPCHLLLVVCFVPPGITHDHILAENPAATCSPCRPCQFWWSKRCWGGRGSLSPPAQWSHGTVFPQTGRCTATFASPSMGKI